MNIICGILWEQCNPGLKSIMKGNKNYPTKLKKDYLWLMKDKKNITVGLYVKLNKSDILDQRIRGFINTRQG